MSFGFLTYNWQCQRLKTLNNIQFHNNNNGVLCVCVLLQVLPVLLGICPQKCCVKTRMENRLMCGLAVRHNFTLTCCLRSFWYTCRFWYVRDEIAFSVRTKILKELGVYSYEDADIESEVGSFNSWRALWKNRTSRYISFFRPSFNCILFPMFCLLVEGEYVSDFSVLKYY